jgi:hypothetical protein
MPDRLSLRPTLLLVALAFGLAFAMFDSYGESPSEPDSGGKS